MFSSFRPTSTTFSSQKPEKEECKECKMLETNNRVLHKQIEELVKKQMELENKLEDAESLIKDMKKRK
jgi:predicted RNase H-like nuclease (RuvC/YqgF family)